MTTARLLTRAAAVALAVAVTATAQAFIYDEAVNGDLSGDRLSPTLLIASPGVNTLAMTSVTGDRDYFTFAVPTSLVLSSIFHKTYVSADDLSFFALQVGSTLTEPPTGTNAANLLGYVHFGAVTVGSEIIDNLANSNSLSPPAMGFTAPLAAGNYAFWVQQTGTAAQYSFDFALTPVPEPEQWALLLSGFLLLAWQVRRFRTSSTTSVR
jgi:hypothetical protein